MSEHGQSDGVNRENTAITPHTGQHGIEGQHAAFHVHGPTRDEFRSSGPGWAAEVEIEQGVIRRASTTGVPSHHEDGTMDTCRALVRRLNLDGGKWGEVKEIKACVGGGVDGEARDALDQSNRLGVHVVRADVDQDFWTQLDRDASATLLTSVIEEALPRIWQAVLKKKKFASSGEVLALNALRVPWAALPSVVAAFRERYGQEARRIGFKEVWVVGWNGGAITERLDT